jgi:hypothetical protein
MTDHSSVEIGRMLECFGRYGTISHRPGPQAARAQARPAPGSGGEGGTALNSETDLDRLLADWSESQALSAPRSAAIRAAASVAEEHPRAPRCLVVRLRPLVGGNGDPGVPKLGARPCAKRLHEVGAGRHCAS